MDESQVIPSRKALDESDSGVLLRVDRVTDDSVKSPRTLYCTDIEGTKLRVALQDSSLSTGWETDQWYRFDGVIQSQTLETELRVASETGSVEPIDAPGMQSFPPHSELEDPGLIQTDTSSEIIAVAVHPRVADGAAGVRVGDPATFEIGAVCFAHCLQAGETTVYHREESELRDEHLLLQHVFEDLSNLDGATLVTDETDHSPIKMLYQRLALAADGEIIDSGARHVLDDCFHASIDRIAERTESETVMRAAQKLDIAANPVSLDNHNIGINPADWRGEWKKLPEALSTVSDPRMVDRDYATLVERYVGAEDELADLSQLAQCLKAYASADLELIRGFAAHGSLDQLGCLQIAGRGPRHI